MPNVAFNPLQDRQSELEVKAKRADHLYSNAREKLANRRNVNILI